MPELPEVEAARRAIEEHCIGKKIKRALVAEDPKVIDGVSPSDFQSSLIGKIIVSARRKGKNMWLQLNSPPFPSFQFGMAGAIYIKGVAVTKYRRSAVNDTDEWPSKYSKVFIELDDGLELSFTDKRRFAKVRLLENPESVPPISELGPDALFEPMQEDEFVDSLSKKKTAIKALLLDQSFIAGIGNWIADEVLYQARIHPLQIAASLSKEKCKAFLKCINEVIGKALDVGADSNQFPSNWIFHSREKKPGKAFVDGKKIEFITAGGRTSAFVPELQKLTGNQTGKAPSKPRKQTKKQGDDGAAESRESADEDENEKKKDQNIKPRAGRKSKSTHSSDDDGPPKKTPKMTVDKKVKVLKASKKAKIRCESDNDEDEDEQMEAVKKKTKKEEKSEIQKIGIKTSGRNAKQKKKSTN